MTPELIAKLCCPFDKHDLDLNIFTRDTDNKIIEGMLVCKHCRRYYPIVYGVPIMSPDEYREQELELPMLKRWEHRLGEGSLVDFRLEDGKKETFQLPEH